MINETIPETPADMAAAAAAASEPVSNRMSISTGPDAKIFSVSSTTLKDRTILVTGAGTDLGHAVCLAVAHAGASVLIMDRKQRQLTGLYDKISETNSNSHMIVEFDMLMAQHEDFSVLADGLSSRIQELHGIVHCAMWSVPLSPIVNSNTEHWYSAYDRQVVRPMTLTRVLASLLNFSDNASIVFPTLHAGRQGCAYWGALGAAFAALENFCETLAIEWHDYDTRVNSLDISEVRTALRKQFYPAESGDNLKAPHDANVVNTFIHLLEQNCRITGFKMNLQKETK